MTAKGAEPFWVNSAMEHIRSLLTGNTFFTLSIKDIKVTVKGKHVAKLTATVERRYPDFKETIFPVIKYTFDPKRKFAHKGWLDA